MLQEFLTCATHTHERYSDIEDKLASVGIQIEVLNLIFVASPPTYTHNHIRNHSEAILKLAQTWLRHSQICLHWSESQRFSKLGRQSNKLSQMEP